MTSKNSMIAIASVCVKRACRRGAKSSTSRRKNWFPLQFNLIDDFRKIHRYLQTAKKGLYAYTRASNGARFRERNSFSKSVEKYLFHAIDNTMARVVCNRRFDLREERASTIFMIYVYVKGRFSHLSMCGVLRGYIYMIRL